jgi:betaine-aldehyde dehydrogenase
MQVESEHITALLIGGEPVAGDGAGLAVENPFTTGTIAEPRAASPEQVDGAVTAAREAWPAWARTPAGERCELLHEVASRLREGAEGLARTMTAEGGKPLVENRDELEWTAAAFDYYAEIGRDHAGRVIPPIESTQLAMVLKDPLGVVGCIVPWNYPLLLLAWKVAPALAAGNCIVCKPSELTPLSTLALAGAFEQLPAGVVNILAGAGDVGAAIASHPAVDCVAFTGSVATGHKVAEACTPRMARMNLEMGGKDAFIVCADVYTGDLENAVRCMRELRAGTVWINDPLTDNDAGPFGGFKQSGLGRELGREGLEAFQETKHVHIESKIERKEWWYPYRQYGESR